MIVLFSKDNHRLNSLRSTLMNILEGALPFFGCKVGYSKWMSSTHRITSVEFYSFETKQLHLLCPTHYDFCMANMITCDEIKIDGNKY